MHITFASLLIVSASLCGMAQAPAQQPAPELPKIFDTARYVYVESGSGDRLSGDTTTEDRKAIYNLEKLLRSWNRYILTLSREHADLVLVVHKSLAGTGSSIPVVVGQPRQPGKSPFPRDPSDPSSPTQAGGPGLGTEAGSPDDELAVYILNGSDSLSGPIWHETGKNGLAMPKLTLFQHLKQDVEDSYPH